MHNAVNETEIFVKNNTVTSVFTQKEILHMTSSSIIHHNPSQSLFLYGLLLSLVFFLTSTPQKKKIFLCILQSSLVI